MIAYHQLPVSADVDAVDDQRQQAIYTTLTKPLIDSLVKFFAGKKVLECYAGRGHLSALLADKGVDIKSTSLQMSHDASQTRGYAWPVEQLSVMEAIDRYRDWMDVLLVAWPVADESLFRALPCLPEDCPIVFIGEVTDYNCQPFPFLGGCATDNFFDAVREIPELTAQLEYPTRRFDQIKVYQRF